MKTFEEFSQPDFVENKFIVTIDTQEEYWDCMKYLEKFGYHWGTVDTKPTYKNYFGEYKNFSVVLNPSKNLMYGSLNFFEWRSGDYQNCIFINFKDIEKESNKKYRKLTHPDDPYNEEDWGFEEIQ